MEWNDAYQEYADYEYSLQSVYQSSNSDILAIMRNMSVGYDDGRIFTAYLFSGDSALQGIANFFAGFGNNPQGDVDGLLLSPEYDNDTVNIFGNEQSWRNVFQDYANGNYSTLDVHTASEFLDILSTWIGMRDVNSLLIDDMPPIPITVIQDFYYLAEKYLPIDYSCVE